MSYHGDLIPVTVIAKGSFLKVNSRTKRGEIPIPEQMKNLPLTEGGYLKPWFVKGEDFRVTDGGKAWLSVSKKACWICGNPFDVSLYAMVGDATSAVIRIYREPPCHKECAEYAMQVCPFILYPNAKRREAGLDYEDTLDHGNENARVVVEGNNPGEYFISMVSNFSYHHEHQVTAFEKSDLVEMQHWVGGCKQATLPDPILPPDLIPDALKDRI